MQINQTKGFLFTFCGLDGCGKTTILTQLKRDLEKEYDVIGVVHIRSENI